MKIFRVRDKLEAKCRESLCQTCSEAYGNKCLAFPLESRPWVEEVVFWGDSGRGDHNRMIQKCAKHNPSGRRPLGPVTWNN
jgi:hypothetical protein